MIFPINIQKVNREAFQWSCLDQSDKMSSSCSSELPGVLHHDNKVHVAVNRGTDSRIIVDKLLFGHLGTKGNEVNEQLISITVRLKSENRGSDYKKTDDFCKSECRCDRTLKDYF